MVNTSLPILATTLFSFGCLILIGLLIHLIHRVRSDRDYTPRRLRGRMGTARLLTTLGALVLILAAQPIFWVSSQLRSYKVLHPGQQLCALDVYTPADRLPRLIYSTRGDRGEELVEVFPVRDARMRINGELIEWPGWLAPFGLRKFFKLTSVEFFEDGSVEDSILTFSTPIHQGSMPLFDFLSRWPDKIALAQTKQLSTPIIAAESDFSRAVFLKNEELVLE